MIAENVVERAKRLVREAREWMEKNYRVPDSVGGYVMSPEAFTRLTGLEPHPKTYDLTPTGARVLVALDPRPRETSGGLHIPETALNELGNRGWIVAVGPDVMAPSMYPFAPKVEKPEDLLGLHVYFGLSGNPFRLGLHDTKWDAPLRVMTARDIWLSDHRPWNDPWEMDD